MLHTLRRRVWSNAYCPDLGTRRGLTRKEVS